MKIEECLFGKVVIDGVPYTKDVIVSRGGIQENWWRKEGHSLVKEDLPRIFEEKPDIFIMGCGHSDCVTIPEETRRAFQDRGIRFEAMKTPQACEELNRLFDAGVDAAGGLHLTC